MNTAIKQLLNAEKIPQALLLAGGTKADILLLAKTLFGEPHSNKIQSGNHPDLHFYFPEGKGQLHSITSMHKLINEMALPPFEASKKIFAIIDAEKMLPSASNALLKTLEEPSDDTYFFLLTNYEEALLPTIKSRLTHIKIATHEEKNIDLSPYFALAEKESYDKLLTSLNALDEEDPKALLQAVLHHAKRSPNQFLRISKLVSEAEKALRHNIKPRHILLNLLLQV